LFLFLVTSVSDLKKQDARMGKKVRNRMLMRKFGRNEEKAAE